MGSTFGKLTVVIYLTLLILMTSDSFSSTLLFFCKSILISLALSSKVKISHKKPRSTKRVLYTLQQNSFFSSYPPTEFTISLVAWCENMKIINKYGFFYTKIRGEKREQNKSTAVCLKFLNIYLWGVRFSVMFTYFV